MGKWEKLGIFKQVSQLAASQVYSWLFTMEKFKGFRIGMEMETEPSFKPLTGGMSVCRHGSCHFADPTLAFCEMGPGKFPASKAGSKRRAHVRLDVSGVNLKFNEGLQGSWLQLASSPF